jgi:hypothetical protein
MARRKINKIVNSSFWIYDVQLKENLIKLLIISGLWFALACEKGKETETGIEFFPLEKGFFWEYDVSEESYTVSAPARKLNYQIRERIGDAFTVANQEVFRVERYRRIDDKVSWKLDSVWTAQLTPTQVIRTENNISFTKLIFPIKEGEKWGNSSTTSSQSVVYQYKNTFQKFGDKYFPTIQVIERNDSTAINLNRKYEVYAKNIGLVYKEFTTLEYCQKTPSCIGKGEVDFGTRRILKLKNYGKE